MRSQIASLSESPLTIRYNPSLTVLRGQRSIVQGSSTMKSITILAVALAASIATSPAHADPRGDVMAAFEQAMAQKSYRATSTSQVRGQAMTSTIQAQPPDRFHMSSPESEVIVVPGGSWMKQGDQWMKLPMDMSAMIKGMTLAAMKDSANLVQDVKELDSADVNGCDSKTYAYHSSGEMMGVSVEAEVEVAICGETGLPVRITSVDTKQKTRTVVDYDYAAAVNIQAPN
jgi:hypothetical protein